MSELSKRIEIIVMLVAFCAAIAVPVGMCYIIVHFAIKYW